eukprot:CAMPEP_0114575914 /NCGR_PEP_ID=MMETSP0125-20121206/729_1 /TAXON_ID=485358 ORGANISM="Aristerostoma sp., Strain ATCC 50986" /NCGR_SAMPLE_ID=MMETSP0125 /ASSEMBLY_ACC=CAM_ASM_000245 /LENGTH=158 /DNA_ID=CAMNT_0001764011 /DNA_START=836 /DNA_END=1312 /DNA_ORIENTATION=+
MAELELVLLLMLGELVSDLILELILPFLVISLKSVSQSLDLLGLLEIEGVESLVVGDEQGNSILIFVDLLFQLLDVLLNISLVAIHFLGILLSLLLQFLVELALDLLETLLNILISLSLHIVQPILKIPNLFILSLVITHKLINIVLVSISQLVLKLP